MNKLLKVALFSLAALFSTVSSADNIKIGFVNLPMVMQYSPQAIAATKRLQEKFGPRDKAIKADKERYNSLLKKLEKDSLILSADQKSTIEMEVLKLQRKIKRDEEELTDDIKLQKSKETEATLAIISKAIEDVVLSEKYDLIIREGVMYASKKVDITQKVLDKLKQLDSQKSAKAK